MNKKNSKLINDIKKICIVKNLKTPCELEIKKLLIKRLLIEDRER